MNQISVTECAALLGHSRQHILALCNAGRLEAVKIGATWAIPSPPIVQPSGKLRGRPRKPIPAP